MTLGAFGWGTHVPRSDNPSRESKYRPSVVVMQNGALFAVVFGQSQAEPGCRTESIGPADSVFSRWGLANETFFHATVELTPPDFAPWGVFVTNLASATDPAASAEHDLWLRLRALAGSKR
ncbi:MAG: hypothetical protein ACHREM_03900 [Polyangiales bacterium]